MRRGRYAPRPSLSTRIRGDINATAGFFSSPNVQATQLVLRALYFHAGYFDAERISNYGTKLLRSSAVVFQSAERIIFISS